MEKNEKPFACNIDGCQMTFTNEDHLNWHQKKHDMCLNLGLASKNAEAADQTPTPTRFIRNCEEVGLFQDLQNVNPFDETFKKAVELSRSGGLHVPTGSNEDSLHTPHIFPAMETSVSLAPAVHRVHSHDNDSEFRLEVDDDRGSSPEIIGLTIDEGDGDRTNGSKLAGEDLRGRLKEVLKNKERHLMEKQLTPNIVITPAPRERLQGGQMSAEQRKRKRDGLTQEAARNIREVNRVAQMRCRQRKQVMLKAMEGDLNRLREQNVKLDMENSAYKSKIQALKHILEKEKQKEPVKDPDLLRTIEDVLESSVMVVLSRDKSKLQPKGSPRLQPQRPLAQNGRQVLPIAPSAVIRTARNVVSLADPKPVVIKVDGPVTQLQMSFLPPQV